MTLRPYRMGRAEKAVDAGHRDHLHAMHNAKTFGRNGLTREAVARRREGQVPERIVLGIYRLPQTSRHREMRLHGGHSLGFCSRGCSDGYLVPNSVQIGNERRQQRLPRRSFARGQAPANASLETIIRAGTKPIFMYLEVTKMLSIDSTPNAPSVHRFWNNSNRLWRFRSVGHCGTWFRRSRNPRKSAIFACYRRTRLLRGSRFPCSTTAIAL